MKRTLLITCAVLLLSGGGAWWGFRALDRVEATPARFETAAPGLVEVKVTETGMIEPLSKVEVKSKVGGRIARLLVQEGSRVKAGELLGEIEPTEINSQVEQTRAQVDGSRARLEQAKRGVRYQVAQTQAGRRQAEEALHAAEARLQVSQEECRAQPELTASAVA